VAQAVGDEEAQSLALVGLSRVALRAGDYERVRSLASRARELVRALGPQANVAPLHLLAAGTRHAGDYDTAAGLYAQSLELNRQRGDDSMVAAELHNLGHVELHRGNVPAAAEHFAGADELRGSGNPYDVAMQHLERAALAFTRGDPARTAELLDAAESTLVEAGIVLDPDDAFEVGWLRAQLG
jgi:tetratricopeptide (TPR) repeat protein